MMFLNSEEIAELTGVRNGAKGSTRNACQIAALRKMKIPHYVNAAGRPVVARAIIEGSRDQPVAHKTWEPRIA